MGTYTFGYMYQWGRYVRDMQVQGTRGEGARVAYVVQGIFARMLAFELGELEFHASRMYRLSQRGPCRPCALSAPP